MKAIVRGVQFASTVLLCFAFGSSAWAIGDPERGRAFVEAFECEACHATDGTSVAPGISIISGQKSGYLYRTMLHFKAGRFEDRDGVVVQRRHPVMSRITKALNISDIRDIAAYYASKDCNSAPDREPAIVVPQGIEFCETCHGGRRDNPWTDTPNLAGQDHAYLLQQLHRLWDGMEQMDENNVRYHRLSEVMFVNTQEEHLSQIADYYAGMPCRK